jgi:hypothetical protein
VETASLNYFFEHAKKMSSSVDHLVAELDRLRRDQEAANTEMAAAIAAAEERRRMKSEEVAARSRALEAAIRRAAVSTLADRADRQDRQDREELARNVRRRIDEALDARTGIDPATRALREVFVDRSWNPYMADSEETTTDCSDTEVCCRRVL